MISLLPKPLNNSANPLTADQWVVAKLPVRLELSANDAAFPSGWVLLRGKLHRQGQDFSACLFAETGGNAGELHSYPIPVTRRGTILELIFLPSGVKRLFLEPMRSFGTFELKDVTLVSVGHLERILRMWRRVLPLYLKYSRSRRQRVGLRFYLPFVNLQGAYHIAGKFRAYAPELSYGQWIEAFDVLTSRDRRLIRRHIGRWRQRPNFLIIIAINNDNKAGLAQTLASLQHQRYRNFRVSILVSPETEIDFSRLSLRRWAEVLTPTCQTEQIRVANSGWEKDDMSTWIVPLAPGTILAEHALYWLAHEAVNYAATGFVYTDHDCLQDDNLRSDPVFKPDWSAELLRSTNYIGVSAVVRADVLTRAGGLSSRNIENLDFHELFLRITEQLTEASIRHIPAVLWHLPRYVSEAKPVAVPYQENPVAAHLRRMGVAATVKQFPDGRYRVIYELPVPPPMVSIVIPTRDALSHLRPCVESVLKTSSFDRFELLVVDNLSENPETLTYLEELTKTPRVRVLRYPHPFNYSAINNFAATEANGDVLCLLNNDTEVISPDWVEEMLGHLTQPRVGVVGAKLYYSDGRVQHGGDTVGPGGCAHHLHSGLEMDAPGYCHRALLAQDLSAVTAACLMTWRHLFQDLGGFNEQDLPVAFNDVDYCLRVRDAGYRVVWTPHARLYHHESASRGHDDSPEKAARMRREVDFMRRRWKHVMGHDPFYNPNLSYDRPDFSLSNTPMINKPWLAE